MSIGRLAPRLEFEQQVGSLVQQPEAQQRRRRLAAGARVAVRVLAAELLHEQRAQQLMAAVHRRVVGVL